MRLVVPVLIGIGVVSLCASSNAWAYNSGNESNPGPGNLQEDLAAGPFGWMMPGSFAPSVGDKDNWNEHGRLLQVAFDISGLPLSIGDPVKVTLFTDKNKTVAGFQSLSPAQFSGDHSANTSKERTYTIPAIAGMPDHSFALWDWVNGNESCPSDVGSSDPQTCHTLRYHLGSFNSTHFGAQAQGTYAHYHQLAKDRATQCAKLGERMFASGLDTIAPEYADGFVLECEREALAIEAFGQHFLQDAWASGHMWQRWGSPSAADFPTRLSTVPAFSSFTLDVDRLDVARLVALTAGIFHGVGRFGGVATERDRLSGGAQVVPSLGADALGDLFADEVINANGAQFRKLMECSAAGLREVYGRTSMRHGTMNNATGIVPAANPTGSTCFGERATNQSMLAAAGIDFLGGLGGVTHLPLDSNLLKNATACTVDCISAALPGGLVDRWRLDVNRIYSWLQLLANDPDLSSGTHAAELAIPALNSLLDVKSNSSYVRASGPPAVYADPTFPAAEIKSWPNVANSSSSEAKEAGRLLARFFNQSHLAEWCTDPEADIDALALRVTSATSAERPAACQICTEFAARHVSISATQPSACTVANETDSLVLSGTSAAASGLSYSDAIHETARSACGCNAPTVVAEVGGPAPGSKSFSGFDKVSVNNKGDVAFVGFTDFSQGFAGAPGTLHATTPLGSSSRLYGGSSINDGPIAEVAAQDRASGSPPSFFIRRYKADGSGESALVGRSSGTVGGICGGGSRAGQTCFSVGPSSADCPSTIAPGAPITFFACVTAPAADFDSATSFMDINDSGMVAFQGLVGGSTQTALLVGSSRSDLKRLWIAPAGMSPQIRPQLSNATNEVVYRDEANHIIVRRYSDSTAEDVSGSSFSSAGQVPGISSDGQFVAFTATGASGPGVYVVKRGSVRTTVALVTSLGDPASPAGRFTSFNGANRIAIATKDLTDGSTQIIVVFSGTRSFRASESQPVQSDVEGVFRVTATLRAGALEVHTPRVITQVGDEFPSGAKVSGAFSLWDPLSQNGDVMGFSLSFEGGSRAVVTAR